MRVGTCTSRSLLLWIGFWILLGDDGADGFLIDRNIRFPSTVRHNCQIPARQQTLVLKAEPSPDEPMPLCDLQTLLRLTNSLNSGGSAKLAIQSGECLLNGEVETRRAKKLFAGDVVTRMGKEYDVEQLVTDKTYKYKPKVKKIKPEPKVDDLGNKEFGGRFRSEDWRKERKVRKLDRKTKNASDKNST
jgi:ribosome-associated protein